MSKSFTNAQEAFEFYFNEINTYGVRTNIGTRAFYNEGFCILDPRDRIIKTEWRQWSNKYAEREWQWYLSRNRSVEELKKFAPKWDEMHGGDNIVNSNYGWQWGRKGQLKKCIDQLRNNPDTRQAWISIYDGKEKSQYQYDTPCTMCVGFSIHPMTNNLDMTVIMRSNDLVHGFCNDQYCFSKLQEYVANRLNLEVGHYYHFAHDLHIYHYHYDLKQKYYYEKK